MDLCTLCISILCAARDCIDSVRLKLIEWLAGNSLTIVINATFINDVLVLDKRGLVSKCRFKGE